MASPDRTVQVLLDEGEVENADDPPVDQVDEDREGLPGHLAAGELDHDVVDRPHLVDVAAVLLGHALLLEDIDDRLDEPVSFGP